MSQPWWHGAIIYQIYPRSFFDTNGDGIGDLPGIARKLDYIAALGVDAIWISPFFRSPMKDFGYDIADYRAVDSIFGADGDFDALIAAAHARDLRVLIDLVLPHSSDEHPWFQESRASRDNPKADWYVWADARPDGTPPNNWLSMFGGPSWQWEPRRGQYYLHHFLREQPNLNWHHPAVAEAMLGEARFWLERGVDGFRLDAIITLIHDLQLRDNPPWDRATPFQLSAGTTLNPCVFQDHIHDRNRPELLGVMERIRKLVDDYGTFTMGEIDDGDTFSNIAAYVGGTTRLHTGYTFQLTQDEFGAARLRDIVTSFERACPDGWHTYAFSNHDVSRPVSRWGARPELAGDPTALAKLLLACLVMMRGNACLYQGEELGLTDADIPRDRMLDPWGLEFWPVFKGRDSVRTPMPWRADAAAAGFTSGAPWLPIPDLHRQLAVDVQEADPSSVLHACRRLLRFRKAHRALVCGSITVRTDAAAPIWAFERVDPDSGSRVLCVFNLSNRPVSWAAGAEWRPLEGHGFSATFDGGAVQLPAFGAFFAAP